MDNFVDYHPSFDGIRGWLMVLGLLLLFTPVVLLLNFGDESWRALLTESRWKALTTPGTAEFHSKWKPIIYFNVGALAVLLLGSLVQIFLFFTHSRFFPKHHIGFMAAMVLYVMISTIFMTRIPAVQEEMATYYAWRILIVMALSSVTIAYVLRSPRVRFTFTR